MYKKTISVTALNSYIKKTIDNDFILSNSNVKGELSNVKIHSSGHIYFSLKDHSSKINCVMFKSNANSLTFIPENGMNVVVSGRISVYEKEGVYQLYCNSMDVDGQGELYIAFEKLKKKLEIEGVFDSSRKKELPVFPGTIGVITSPTGAAIRDIINVSTRRNPKVNLLIYPSLVQGANASQDIVRAVEHLNKIEDVDVIILARGGGSIEELWPFNEEIVARAISASIKPIVTGVGHETDYTISDFVSDKRAATPSQAAELVVPVLKDLEDRLMGYKGLININIDKKIKEEKNKLNLYIKTLQLNSPENYVINQYQAIDKFKNLLDNKIESILEKQLLKISKSYELLSAHNPLNVLNKGYALVEDENNNLITSIKSLKAKEQIKILLKDGSGDFKVQYKEKVNS